jgi:two-component system phosphate regulon sensor histidine kinase PhoR
MRLRVHHPLFAGILGTVGLIVVLVILSAGSGLRSQLKATFQAELGRQLSLAHALVVSAQPTDLDALAGDIADRLDYRVSFIALDGEVLGDSHVVEGRIAEVENHFDRPEVRALLAGSEVSFAERASVTIGESLLYGARITTVGGEDLILRIAAPQNDIQAAVDGVRRTVAVTGFIALLIALAAAYGLSLAFTRPLGSMADGARLLIRGDFSSRLPLSRIAELQDLGIAFNRLTEELQARLSELGRERDEMKTLIDCMAEGVIALNDEGQVLRVNRTARSLLGVSDVPPLAPLDAIVRNADLRSALQHSISDGGQALEMELTGRHVLLASRALDHGGAVTTLLDITELRHLEQVRRDFVANASHELKTPLTSIRGYAETLTDSDPPEALRKQFLESIHANTLRLQRLVDDLLDLSRLESGSWTASREPVHLSEVLAEALDLAGAGGSADRTFEMEGDGEVLADRQGLVQVFRNLIENAIRHTEPDGLIRVTVFLDHVTGMARVYVIDDGEGIPKPSLERIFERFYRADSSRARDFGGTGLGLAIVKHLVTSMGGEIEAESEVGRGTTIGLTLPLHQRDA